MESKEEKLEKLRKERDLEILKKNYKENKFYLSKSGGLSRYGWGENLLFVGMPVRVKKPDNTFRNGIVEYLNIEDENSPKIGVICGKNKVKFEKTFNQVIPDKTLQKLAEFENIEVPEKLQKMPTKQLLTEYRRMRTYTYHFNNYNWSDLSGEDLKKAFKKELFLREHVGPTSEKTRKEDRRKKAKEHHGKRK